MTAEQFRPISNGEVNIIRRIFDLQVCSTYRSVKAIMNQSKILKQGGRVLEVGCGNQPYRHLFGTNIDYEAIDWVGAEEGFLYKLPDVTYYDGEHFPCIDGSFDMVFHTEVIEHVKHLRLFFEECNRVVKKEGEMIFSSPFSARYHYIPYDYWRLTPSSLEYMLISTGFKDIKVIPRSTDICVAAYKIISIGYRLVFSKKIPNLLWAVILLPLWLTALLIGQLSLHLNMGSSDDSLGWTVFCKK